MRIVYFSNTVSNNTHRFVQKLDWPADRLPARRADPSLEVDEPYVLIFPTYGAGHGAGAVPFPVVRFLNDENNRALIRGVIGAGNTNFGSSFTAAADIVAEKCGVPVLHRFEILGTSTDVSTVQQLLQKVNHDTPRLLV